MKYPIAILATVFAVSLLQAQEPPPPPGAPQGAASDFDDDRTPPRLSFTHGQVSFWRPGADDWTRAQINLPLSPGDALYAGQDASFELEIGPRAFIRAGESTQLGLENQEPDFLQVKVTSGHVAIDVREIESGHTIEINTPNAVLAVEKTGYYRIDVTDDRSTFVARRGGSAFITPASGEVEALAQNEQVVVDGVDNPTLNSYAAADLDTWDRWNYERSDRRSETKSARYVPRGVYGTHDLDEHGTWAETADYGPVWTPRHVAADWVPYSDGRWVWDVSFGWTWVDNAPWGWAPSHYGRWVHVHNHWGWTPGPIIAAPVYAPAVVAFFGSHNVRVSVGITAPAVGWVALGWGEPVVPWWGHHDYGRPSWRGWGGPRVVNKTVIHNTNVVNINNINVYQNAHVRNAVVAERADRFGRGEFRHARVRQAEVQRFEPVRGNLNVRPVSASLSPRRERGTRPPDRVLQRPVVATRQPRDAERALRAQGIDVRNKPASAPRIVRGTRPGRDAVRESARESAPVQAAPGQPDVRQQPQSEPRGGRLGNLPRKQNEANRPQDRSARPVPAPPLENERSRAQERRARDAAAEAERQVRPRPEPQNPQAAPRVERSAPQPPREQARPDRPERVRPREDQPQRAEPQQQRQQQDRRMTRPAPAAPAPRQQEEPQRAEPQQRRQQQDRRMTRPAPAAPPQQDQPQRAQPRQRPQQQERRMTRPAPSQPSEPAVREQRRERPVERARPERQRQQEPAVRARPERQPEVRQAQPRPERANRPQRAERKQPPDAGSLKNPSSAGDAPRQAPAKKKAPASGPRHDRSQ